MKKLFYGEFTFAGYEIKAVCETEKELAKVLRTEYYKWRKSWSTTTDTWKTWKEDQGVHYIEIKSGEVFPN